MNLDDFRTQFSSAPTESLSPTELKSMISSRKHPVLKGVRWQLMWEVLIYSLFLLVYYDFFDGHQKSLIWNTLLVAAVLLVLIHSILGYVANHKIIHGPDIGKSLAQYLKKLKLYSIVSICTRVVAILLIMGFFLSTVPIHSDKLFKLSIILLIIPLQVFLLLRVWRKRIRRIQQAHETLTQ